MASKDVMLDIETMSTEPDALVLSIGAIKFDCLGKECPWFGERFFVVPDFMEQVMMGRSISKDTQKFWATQNPEAAAHWADPIPDSKISVQGAMLKLHTFCSDAPRIWANGIVFDIGILEGLFKQAHVKVPWKYNAPRDARTFYDTNPEVRKYAGEVSVLKHHPIVDCESQILRLWEHGWSQ